MKTVIKFILSFICYLLLVPALLGLTVCFTWYALPAIQTTFIGELILDEISRDDIFFGTLGLCILSIILMVFGRLFRVINSSKPNNFYTHLITWLLAIVLAAESIFTFFTARTLSTTMITFTISRKVAIGTGVAAMFIYSILSKKIGTLVNRKIQAYDTAKELNAAGRSSIVWVQILKTIDFVFPELLLLAVLCFAFNFEISLYFIVMLAAFLLPMFGNIICDKRARKEAVQRIEEEKEVVANQTAEAVVDLLQLQQGEIK